jgi:glycosyltransferase involved in cell wall biosynthesis
VTVAKEFSIKVITHFHELPLTYFYLNSADMKNIITYSQLLIGCSQVTANAIEQAGGKNVALLYSFIDPAKVIRRPERSAKLRDALGIPEDTFVWVASGMTSERKGFDLLPDIAEAIDNPKVHIIWVGGRIDDGMVYYTEQRCANPKTKTKIHLVGQQKEDYYPYLDIGNGFLLTSRQDPFPLVMIEAALLGKPIVSFPSGGISEFVQDGMGLVTDDISVGQMAVAMRKVMDGDITLNSQKSQERAHEFDVENGYRNWTQLMDNL